MPVVPVPFKFRVVDAVNVGEPLYGTGSYTDFMRAFAARITALGDEDKKPGWD